MKYNTDFEIIYREIIENQEGLFIAGAPMAFQASDSLETKTEECSMFLQEAADSWACWMQSQGYDVYKLPRTPRTHDWGLTFSVTVHGEESRLYLLTLES